MIPVGTGDRLILIGQIVECIFAAANHKLVERHVFTLCQFLQFFYQRKRQPKGFIDEFTSL